MHSIFLTNAELAELTGYQIAHFQAKWLDAHGFPYEKTISGKPRVLLGYVEKRLGLTTATPLSQFEPDFSCWEQKGI
jgi:hypothetical protein